jgi:PPOX class probable F420-dependent enzyme
MTSPEVEAFLDSQPTIHVASINPDGAPHLVPMWFVRDGATIRFWTFAKSQKVMNLRRDPRVTVMAETGEDYFQLQGVTMNGQAELEEDSVVVADFGLQILDKYYGANPGAAEHLVASAAKRVLVIVRSERIASWDHRKLV